MSKQRVRVFFLGVSRQCHGFFDIFSTELSSGARDTRSPDGDLLSQRLLGK